MSGVLDRALALLRGGDPASARALVSGAVAAADGALARAQACEDRAVFELAAGDVGAAIEAYHDAVAVEVVDADTARLRSRGLLVLAELLARAGDGPAAERAAREATAIGQAGITQVARARAVLARLMLIRGLPAADDAQSALEALWGRAEAPAHLATAALAAASEGGTLPLAPYLDTLPSGALDEVVSAALQLAPAVPAGPAARVLLELAGWLRGSGREDRAIGVLIAATNLGPGQDPLGWVAGFRTLIGMLRRAGRPDEAARAALGLAAAWRTLGDPVASEVAYQAAVRDAELGDDQDLLGEVLRSYALFLAADERVVEADEVLRRAIGATTGVVRGRCRVAHGLVLAHADLPDAAQEALALGRGALPDEDPDALRADVHLDALAHRRPCGCGSEDGVVGALLRLQVLRRAPAGLLGDLHVELRDGRPHVKLTLARDAVGDEMEAVDRAIREALPRALRGAGATGRRAS